MLVVNHFSENYGTPPCNGQAGYVGIRTMHNGLRYKHRAALSNSKSESQPRNNSAQMLILDVGRLTFSKMLNSPRGRWREREREIERERDIHIYIYIWRELEFSQEDMCIWDMTQSWMYSQESLRSRLGVSRAHLGTCEQPWFLQFSSVRTNLWLWHFDGVQEPAKQGSVESFFEDADTTTPQSIPNNSWNSECSWHFIGCVIRIRGWTLGMFLQKSEPERQMRRLSDGSVPQVRRQEISKEI